MAKEPFLFGGSRDLRGTELRREPEEFGAVVKLAVFEHAEDGVQELAHDGDEGREKDRLMNISTGRTIVQYDARSGH